jgi:hypothetical protein
MTTFRRFAQPTKKGTARSLPKWDELWRAKAATAPKVLAQIMLSELVLTAARRELRRQTGQNVEQSELIKLLRGSVLRPDSLEK